MFDSVCTLTLLVMSVHVSAGTASSSPLIACLEPAVCSVSMHSLIRRDLQQTNYRSLQIDFLPPPASPPWSHGDVANMFKICGTRRFCSSVSLSFKMFNVPQQNITTRLMWFTTWCEQRRRDAFGPHPTRQSPRCKTWRAQWGDVLPTALKSPWGFFPRL